MRYLNVLHKIGFGRMGSSGGKGNGIGLIRKLLIYTLVFIYLVTGTPGLSIISRAQEAESACTEQTGTNTGETALSSEKKSLEEKSSDQKFPKKDSSKKKFTESNLSERSTEKKSSEKKSSEKKERIFRKSGKDLDCTIIVKDEDGNSLPTASAMLVTEITEDNPAYDLFESRFNKKLRSKKEGKIRTLRLYDLSFTDQNGYPVTPEEELSITITYKKKDALKVDKEEEVRLFGSSIEKKDLKDDQDISKKKAEKDSVIRPETEEHPAQELKVKTVSWADKEKVKTKIRNDKLYETAYLLEHEGITGIAVIDPDPEEVSSIKKADTDTAGQNQMTGQQQKEEIDETQETWTREQDQTISTISQEQNSQEESTGQAVREETRQRGNPDLQAASTGQKEESAAIAADNQSGSSKDQTVHASIMEEGTAVVDDVYICKIDDGIEHPFRTLNKAVEYARTHLGGSAVIEMLVDYEIPQGDKVTLNQNKDNITITTAATSGGVYNFAPTFTAVQGRRSTDSVEIAILKRGWDGGNADVQALFYVNNGSASLTTRNIFFDGIDSNDVNEETGVFVQHTGRAVYVANGSLTVTDGSTFRNFFTPNVGGAIYSARVKNTRIQGSKSSAIFFENCRATGSMNSYDGGGAIAFIQSSKDGGLIEGATFIDCYTDAAGGAIYVRTTSTTKSFVVANCVFDGHEDLDCIAANRVNARWGGAIYIWDGWFSMSDCDFTDCTATEDGGAVCLDPGQGDRVEMIANCTFNGHDTLPDTVMNAKIGGAIKIHSADKGIGCIRDIIVTNCRTSGAGGGAYFNKAVEEVDGEINFSNCYTTNGSGGGIYFAASVTMKDSVSITFDNCHAGGSNSNSGAMHLNSLGKNTTFTGAKFTDCSAGGDGGCLYISNSSGTYTTKFVSCQFNGHDDDFAITTANAKNGGGIRVTDGLLELVDCTLTNLTVTGDGGAVCTKAGGGDSLILTNCTINGNDGTLTKDGVTVKNATTGGGVFAQVTNGVTLEDVTFKNCQTSGNGGGLYANSPIKETMGDVSFIDCYTTGGNGGGAYFVGVANFGKSDTTDNTVTFKDCHDDSTSSSNGGGGAWFNSTLTLQTGTELEFDSCHSASYGGGAWFAVATTLNNGMVNFKDCSAEKRGGGAYFVNSATLKNIVIFEKCHTDATNDGGGGVYFAASATLNGTVSFEDCYTKANGGSMYFAAGGTLINVRVDGHKNLAATTTNGAKGGAFYLPDSKAVTIHGGEYKNCSASDANGGAVNVGGTKSVLNFEADVVVYNNPQTAAKDVQQKNVVLDCDVNTVIKTTGTVLSPDAHIGVYVPDGTSLYDKHGKTTLQFGTKNTSNANIDRFTNDRDETLFGTEHLDTGIYWGRYICKVVDTDTDKAEHLFTTLMGAVKYARANRSKAFAENGICIVQMLVDYTVPLYDVVTLNTANDKFVFTTAKTQSEAEANGEEYYFTDTLENKAEADRGISVLTRGWNGGSTKAQSLFYVTSGSAMLSITKLIMDGKNGSTQQTGRAICVNGGDLSVSTGSIFRNFYINGGNSSEPGDGGAIYIPSTGIAVINGARFIDCHTESSNGGSIYYYATGKTLTVRSCVFDGHEVLADNTKNANNGGAIFVNDGRLHVSGSTFRDMWTGNVGGAINMNGGGNDWLEISDCVIDGHDTLDASIANATQGGGVWINASSGTKLNDMLVFNCRTSGDGCGLYANSSSSITETTGTINFMNCYSTSGMGGGAYFGNTATFGKSETTGNTVTFTKCFASGSNKDGGGAYFREIVTTKEGTSFCGDDCYAGNNGGAFYLNAGGSLMNVSINGHTGGTDGLSAETANAKSGGAIYSNGNLIIKQNGTGKSDIKNCMASDANGGAVNVVSGKAVSFEGDVVIYGNTGTGTLASQQKNVVLQNQVSNDYNKTINTTSEGLGENAHIGVYVTGMMTGTQTEPYKNHGQFEQNFGTWPSGGSTEYFDAFTNDRNGLYGENSSTQQKIRWTSYLCKLTDSDGKLLYMDNEHKNAAVYKTFQVAFNALKGFGADGIGEVKLYKYDGTEYEYTAVNAIHVELLKNYRQPGSDAVENTAHRFVILKTAANTQSGNKSMDDIYIYNKGNDAGVHSIYATVKRDYIGGSMFTQNAASVDESGNPVRYDLTLEGVILDGNKDADDSASTATTNGGIVMVQAGMFNICEFAILQNSVTDKNGGAVFVAKDAVMTMNAGTITANMAGKGAGIYLEEGAELQLSGSPDFGSKGNMLAPEGDGTTAKRQDIYIAGYLGTVGGSGEDKDDPRLAESLIVKGALDLEKGSIWVGADEAASHALDEEKDNNHWDSQKQFAKFDDSLMTGEGDNKEVRLKNNELEKTLAAFRNATTSEEYYGTTGDDVRCIYWEGVTGSRKVILRKVSTGYAALSDATFAIMKGSKEIEGVDINGNSTKTFTSGSSGVFYIGMLDYGVYVIHEKNYPEGYSGGPYYYLIVDGKGALMSNPSDGFSSPEAAKAKGDEEFKKRKAE